MTLRRYLHFTTWTEPESAIGRPLSTSTSWEQSNYWTQKLKGQVRTH